jgi:hypothetical protein
MPRFQSPSELRQCVLDIAAEIEFSGLAEATALLRYGANFPATTGTEWLGELALAEEKVRDRFTLPAGTREPLSLVLKTARSDRPYGGWH